MDDRIRRITRETPRRRKVRDWRRNRWNGARHDSAGEREHVGRPWEGRGPIEAERQRPAPAC